MTIIIDLIMIALLFGVIIRTFQLTKRLNNLKNIDSELAPMLKNLSFTLANTSNQIEGMRHAAAAIGQSLATQLEQAHELKGDFDFILSHGDRLAQNLEISIREARLLAKKIAPSSPAAVISPANSSDVLNVFTESVLKSAVIEHKTTKNNIRAMLKERFQR